MKKFLFSLACVCFTAQGFCALSTYHQGASEVKKLLDHPDVVKEFSQGELVSEIKLVEDAGTYRIYTLASPSKTVAVKLEYIKSARCGPRMYSLQIVSL
jgi:hypothetical protein